MSQKYPECFRLKMLRNQISFAEEILEFLERKGVRLEDQDCKTLKPKDLIYELFELDPDKIEAERTAMLEEQRAENEQVI